MLMEGAESRDEIIKVTERIIGCAYTISNALGVGFLEKVYQNALAHELRKAGLSVAQQYPIQVRYNGIIVGDYAVDLLVEEQVIVEWKVAKALDDVHLAHCLNYLKATNLRIGLLLNFGKPRVEVKRVVRDP